ncbi:MAG: hypothetical protein R3F43_06345 [bacterium]
MLGPIFFDVEVVGAANLKRACPDAVSCFLLPPCWAEVERRLRARGTETEETLARRLATGRRELGEAHTFDYLVLNDALAEAVDDLDAVYRAARQRAVERLPLLARVRAEAEAG